MRSIIVFCAAAVGVAACAGRPASEPAAPPSRNVPPPAVRRETVTVRDPELERRLDRLELELLERDALIEQLNQRLTDTRDEVVRTMAKLQATASRAEAASVVAEADVALRALRSTPGASQLPELAQVTALARRSSQEFDRQNFGGAIYLATQVKAQANAARARLSSGQGDTRPGEMHFAVPIELKVLSRGNVRDGPATTFDILFSVDAGTRLTGISRMDEWVRILDAGGRAGWIYRPLVGRP